MICSFCPRTLDWHEGAIPVPYNHSNLDSDEVLYYVEGNYKARKGIEIESISVHPQGIPHGPHPGTIEKAIGATFTDELAVMCDTFRPLFMTAAALDLDDPKYPASWEEDTFPTAGGTHAPDGSPLKSRKKGGTASNGAASNSTGKRSGGKKSVDTW